MIKIKTSIIAIVAIGMMNCAACSKDDNSNHQIVVTPDAPVTDFDGNTYQTMKIGDQVWMVENLKSTHYSDGTTIQNFSYNDNVENVTTYGRLYYYSAVMKGAASSNSNPSNVQGIAPVGWHIPSKAEWQQLANYLGGLNVAGGKMKETGNTHWIEPNIGATNESMFSALPAGMHDFTNIFQWFGDHCTFASSTSNPSQNGVFVIMLKTTDAVMVIGNFHPVDAVSVRCIKD